MDANLIWSIVLAAVGITGLWLAGSKNIWGWAISLGAQVLWIVFALVSGQYGFLLSAVAYGFVYARGFRRWRKDEAEGRKRDSFEFDQSELPEVDVESEQDKIIPSVRYKTYRVGNWSMEIIDPDPYGDSDGNPKYARSAILSWIAWLRYLERDKDAS